MISIGGVGQTAAKKERSSEVAAVQRLRAIGIQVTCAVFHFASFFSKLTIFIFLTVTV